MDNNDKLNNLKNGSDARRMKDLEIINKELENPSKGRLPEYVFKENFYEFFKTGKNNTDVNLTLKWLELSGGPYNEVDITDDVGNIVFTVPGLMSRPSINEKVSRKVDFNDLGHKAEQKNKWMAGAGDKLMENTLNESKNDILETGTIADDRKRWKEIFSRYESETTEPEVKLTEEEKKNLTNLGLNYDD